MSERSQYLEDILQKIKQGNVVLFLGAGASFEAGGPLGNDLAKYVKDKFPKIDQSLIDFIDICQDVIDTPPYDKNMLEDFIRTKVGLLQPAYSHKKMTKFNWAAIFTTNFDDLIEVAYRINPDRHKSCQAIFSDNFQVNIADRSKVYIFKLMGSVTAIDGEAGSMVLSRADYHIALVRRRKYLDLLLDFVKTGTILFVGYSFNDRLALDIMDEIIRTYGKERMPWSFALYNDFPNDEKTLYKFSSRKIIPLKYDFTQFMDYLDKNYEKNGIVKAEQHDHIIQILRGHQIEIGETEARQYSEYFEIIDESKINQDPGNKDEFFMGTNKSLGTLREGWDFQRAIYVSKDFKRTVDGKIASGSIKERIIDELNKYSIEDNKIILIRGMAGVGKTMLLRRIAYDVYKSGVSPVIVINPSRANFDYKLIAGYIESLNYKLNNQIHEGENILPIKPVIIIDNAASQIRHVNRLKNYLTSRGRPVLIVAAERTGEWELMWSTFQFRMPKNNIYEVDEQLNSDEKQRLVDHLYGMGYIASKGLLWDNLIDKNFDNSFFATIYSLVHPSKKPLNLIIQDQYNKLTDLSQKAFQNICCFHQFDLKINYELLVRSLNCSYGDFITDVIGKDASKVIFEEEDYAGNLLYRSHHRIIAQKTVETFFADSEMQKDIFLRILKNCILTNHKEREICEKLLIDYIGPNSKLKIFSYEQQREIFEATCENNQIRSLIHHWGVLESDNHNYRNAEKLLKLAIDTPRDDEAFRGESDQNILTSLGTLYSRIGIDFLKRGKQKEAEEYFEKADVAFQDAKHGEFPNGHAYHSHANMWYLRGNKTSNTIEKIICYAMAIEILSIAKDNLNPDDLQPIYELDTIIWSNIGNESKIDRDIHILRTKYKTARGYFLIAEMLSRKAKDKEDQQKKELYADALAKVEEGLEYFPNDEHCLLLRSKLIKKNDPNNLQSLFKSLQKCKLSLSMPNAWLLYELGRTAFILEYYDVAKDYFKELETGVGIGHKLRSRGRYPVLDAEGVKREFDGTILNILSQNEGYIRCDSLRKLRYHIVFRPVACKFTASVGDQVRFNIEFNYRGPRAENIKKIN